MKTRKTIGRKMALFMLAFLSLTGLSTLKAQMSSVVPTEYTNGMTNPLMGFRDGADNALKDYPYVTLVRDYIEYNFLENSASDGVQKIIDFVNNQYRDIEKHNVKLIPRIMLLWDEGEDYFPADIPYSDQEDQWKTEQLKVRLEAFVAKLGQAMNNDPRIAFVETGLIGKWGEQENPVGVDDPSIGTAKQTWAKILGVAFHNAFPNKKCLVRNPEATWDNSYKFGAYFDSYGAWSKSNDPDDDYPTLIKYNKAPYELYKYNYSQGEVAYSMADPRQIGEDEDETVQTPIYRQWFIDYVRSLQSTTCGLEFDHENPANDAGASIIQKTFGYRFLMKNFSCNPRVEPGGTLNISASILNDGSAPMYENWPLAVVIINESTKQIVQTSVIPADITKWYPGTNYDWKPAAPPSLGTGTRKYLTPAVENVVNGSIQIPAGFTPGQYLVGLTILEPTTMKPGVFFSITNFFQASNTQPLCRIGIGTNASSFTLNSSIFDVFNWKNDTRYYEKTILANVPVTSVTVAPTTLSVGIGGTGQLTPNVLPVNATNKNVTWTSSNTTIATVDANGLVTGKAVGTAVVTVKTVDGNKTATCNITVANIPVTSVSVAPATLSLQINQTATLVPTVLPANASNKNVTWLSSNTTIATVVNGLVTAKAVGTANITVTTVDGAKTAICAVTVTPITGDPIPWIEPFTYTNGKTSNPAPRTWTATNMSVQNNEMSFNSTTAGVFTTGPINISAGAVTVSVKVRGGTGLDVGQDYLRLYKKVDGGAEVQIAAANGPQAAATWTVTNVTGSSLVLVLRAYVSATSEYYYFDDLSVTSSVKLNQTITFPAIATKTVGDADFNPGATASSGLVVTYTSSNTAVATIVSGNIHIVAAGTANITASQAGNTTYNAAPNVVQTLTVNPAGTCSLPWSKADFSLGMGSAPYSSGAIDISCASSVTLAMDLSETDYFESDDNITVSYKVNGGTAVQVVQKVNDFTSYAVNVPNISGNTLEVLITAVTHDALEIYYIKNLKVTEAGACVDQLPWAKADISVNNTTITNQSQGVVNTSCSSSITITADVEGLGGLDLGDYCQMFYKIDGGAQQTLFDIKNLAGAFAKKPFSKTVSANTSVELILNAKNTFADEIYKITNIKISSSGLKSASIENMANSNKAGNSVMVYPNPVANTLYIDHAEGANIRIFNIQGQIIYNKNVMGSQTNIDVAELKASGLILVHITAGDETSMFKVSVIK